MSRVAAAGERDLTALRDGFRGRLIRPGDLGYDQARRVWNASVDRYPELILRCTSDADVVAAVRFARGCGLPVAVRGGGHSLAGLSVCDGGLVVDLSPMKGLRVDPERRVATARAGLTWAELDAAAAEAGLATTGGQVASTGIAGLTLGGGLGWLMRRHGLTCDNLLAVELVTAAGDRLRVTDDSEPELFWGLRGGGGNFGIATSFEYRLHPLGQVLGGYLVHRADAAPTVLRRWRDLLATAPDDLATEALLFTAPPQSAFPEHLQGKLVLALSVCWTGGVEAGERALRPLRQLGPPEADLVFPMPYTTLQTLHSAPHGRHRSERSDFLPRLGDDAIDAVAEQAMGMVSPTCQLVVVHLEGRMRRVGAHETAFAHRRAGFFVTASAFWTEPAQSDQHQAWVRDAWRAVHPYAHGVYVNFLGDEGRERVHSAYAPDTYQRLVALKDRYDPTNFFRLNHNIAPSAGRAGPVPAQPAQPARRSP